MRNLAKATLASVVLMFGAAAPAVAGDGPSENAKAYGKYCKEESKKHVKGEKGSPFSQCVKAMAQLDKGKADSPREACKDLSKKHVKGMKRTPFAECVKGGKKLEEEETEQV
ncbi:hypothetical protein HJD18_10365 [Thermoleophilia bacterium SCSIO 60948]|nr:hypothetical protein HJD18_10365 [Thermoleophilia bacterium SCSIO 60948]